MIEIIPNWHPVFVHFTVALLSVSLGLSVLNLAVKCDEAAVVAKWTLWMGAASSLLTLAAGIYAYNTVAHDTPSHEAMTEHKNLALMTLTLLVPVVYWSVVSHRKGKKPGAGFVMLFLLVGGMLASTAWHGGEVVYRYGIGVMSLPKLDTHDHAGHVDEANGEGHSDSGHGHGDSGGADAVDVPMGDDMDMGSMKMSSTGMSSNEAGHSDSGHAHSHGNSGEADAVDVSMGDDMDMGGMNMSSTGMSSKKAGSERQ